MSLRVVLPQIQDPAKVTFFLHHVWAKSLDLHREALLVRISPQRPCEQFDSASRESGGCSTKGERYAAWPPVCLYLWFDEGIYK